MKKEKLILAVLQELDYAATVEALNKEGFFVTLLSSTGGFFKKKNMTLMIGVEEEKAQRVIDILAEKAGRRVKEVYIDSAMNALNVGAVMADAPLVPIERQTAGVTVFVLNMDHMEKH